MVGSTLPLTHFETQEQQDRQGGHFLLQQLQQGSAGAQFVPGPELQVIQHTQPSNFNGDAPNLLDTLAEVTVKHETVEVVTTEAPPRRKKMKLSKDEKICGVCGDRALGCNFDAVSCESCKAFFRRNAFKTDMRCLFDGNCRIDINTRRFCPYCRLAKCFEIGMKKELILGEDEKKKRLEKVHNNKDKRKPSRSNSTSLQMPASPTGPMSLGMPSHSACDPMNMLSLLLCHRSHNASTDIPPKKFSCDTNEPCRQLTPEEVYMVNKLDQSYENSFKIDIDPPSGINRVNPDLNQLVNQSTVTVLKQIKFAKQMEDFAQLPQDVQIAMLKSSVVQVLFIRSVALYDEGQNAWMTPKGAIPTTILKSGTGFDEMHREHVVMCKSFKALVKEDQILIALMVILTLFNPQANVASCKDLLANLQDKYMVLMKHYVEARYSFTESSRMFTDLLSHMAQLRLMAERHGKVLLDVNPMQVEPIMLEVLDLK